MGAPAGSELRLRALSALVLAVVALGATGAGGAPFRVLWLAAAIAVAWEWNSMTRTAPLWPLTSVAGLSFAALSVAQLMGAVALVYIVIVGGTALALGLLAPTRTSRLWALGGFAYAAVLALVPSTVRDDPALGLAAILWMFAVVWTTDVVAYFVGRAVGGPKLWPRVSPKKTWSGFLGGLLGAVVAGIGVAALAPPANGEAARLGLVAIVVASAIASVASQLGDLAESALKRRFDVKDSSRLIPGHGGVMDRLDGFVAVALLFGLALAGSKLAR